MFARSDGRFCVVKKISEKAWLEKKKANEKN